ncbi:D-glycero-alpha-D-manno-heptose-1,7-bisphosphate 7-phosphatase [Chloroflexota bacterium]
MPLSLKQRPKKADVMTKAVFLDRDGVVNELVYYPEQGIVDSPFTVEQFRLLPGVGEAIRNLHGRDHKVILVSNQPGMAKGNFSKDIFEEISKKMKEVLAKDGAFLDAEYYCFHHPEAKVERFRVNCKCRKPKPGLILKAAQDMDIDLSQSWMIGDGVTDTQAGRRAGCRTILLGRMKCELCRLMDEEGTTPDAICSDLSEAVEKIRTTE